MTRHIDAFSIDSEIEFQRHVGDPTVLIALGLGVERAMDGSAVLGPNHPALVYRYPSRNDDTRTLIAAALPPRGFIYSKGYVHGVLTSGDASTPSILALLGFMNTFVCDWWVRRFVDRHVTKQVIENIPLPSWTESEIDEVATYVSVILAASGLTEIAGDREILAVPKGMSVETANAKIQACAVRGFDLTASAWRTILDDFSERAYDQSLKKDVVDLVSKK
jgi:hypothetical protein